MFALRNLYKTLFRGSECFPRIVSPPPLNSSGSIVQRRRVYLNFASSADNAKFRQNWRRIFSASTPCSTRKRGESKACEIIQHIFLSKCWPINSPILRGNYERGPSQELKKKEEFISYFASRSFKIKQSDVISTKLWKLKPLNRVWLLRRWMEFNQCSFW